MPSHSEENLVPLRWVFRYVWTYVSHGSIVILWARAGNTCNNRNDIMLNNEILYGSMVKL
jgi:hypothetical protein